MNKDLTSDEVNNPIPAFQLFFRCYSLSDVRDQMKQIEKQLLERSFTHDKESNEYDNTLFFFEQLDKFIHAAYVMQKVFTV
jgi:hypothetical protein